VATSAVSPGRVDARRNRERLVAAARALFAAHGIDVPAREIARSARLGAATLYRHFPTRDDLVDAVLEDAFAEFLAAAEAALEEPDGWTGFTSFIEAASLLHVGNRGLRDITETQAHGGPLAAAMRSRIRPLLARLVERAQEQGTLRPDFAPQDISLLFWATDRAIDLAGAVAPGIWRRQLGFIIDGLRREAAQPLPEPPLTYPQLDRIGGRRRG
jgi:AcrR family transcriptional regulator